MKKHFKTAEHLSEEERVQREMEELRRGIIGLGESSHAKTYYPQLLEQIAQLRRYEALFAQSMELLFLVEQPSSKIIECNQAAKDLLTCGLSEDTTFRSLVSSAQHYIVEKLLQQAGGPHRLQLHLSNQKELIPLEIRATHVEFEDQRFVVFAAVDIREKIAAELRQQNLEMRLEQAEQLKALGTFAAGIAHDFNNLLTGLGGNASLLLDDFLQSGMDTELLLEILNIVDSATKLTRQLLDYARGTEDEYQRFDVHDEILRTKEFFSRTHRRLAITTQLEARHTKIEGSRTQYGQVLLNLLINAADAITGQGKIHIITRDRSLDLNQATQLSVMEGDYIELLIKDSGKGMSAATLKQVFDPFFTTKERGKGTGLGLATVFRIVVEHGGWVRAESELGQGTTFFVGLPFSRAQAIEAPNPFPSY